MEFNTLRDLIQYYLDNCNDYKKFITVGGFKKIVSNIRNKYIVRINPIPPLFYKWTSDMLKCKITLDRKAFSTTYCHYLPPVNPANYFKLRQDMLKCKITLDRKAFSTTYYHYPPPVNPANCFKLMQMEAEIIFETLKHAFILRNNNDDYNRAMNDILKDLSPFIDSTHEANLNKSKNAAANMNSPVEEYLRLKDETYYKMNNIAYNANALPVYVYAIFILFYEWLEKQIPNDEINNNNQPKTFKTILNEVQIEKLHEIFIQEEFIKNIEIDDFVYIFSNKIINPNMKRIEWKKNKTQLCYLLEKIVEGEYKTSLINKCFKVKGIPIAPNSRTSSRQPQINKILKEIGLNM